MYWRLEKHIVEKFVDFTRRLFRYNSQFTNLDLEIVTVASGSEPFAFEQFFEENEKYPMVAVQCVGGNYTGAAFNDQIGAYDGDKVDFGARAQTFKTIDASHTLAAQIPQDAYDQTLRGLSLFYAWDGLQNGGDDILVNLYRDYTTSPVLLASASLPGTTSKEYWFPYADFDVATLLSGSDYWIEIVATSQSSYRIGFDTDASSLYKYDGTTATGSVTGAVILPVFLRYGGNFEGTVTLRCMDKKNSAMPRDLAELLSQYIILTRHAQLSRASNAVNATKIDALNAGLIDEWLGNGIFIKAIREGNIEMRRRGENDTIFTVPVSVDIFAEWFQDYPAQGLQGINITAVASDP